MTKEEQNIYFAILRSAIWENDLDVTIPQGYDLSPIIQELENNALLGVAGAALKNTGLLTPRQRRYLISHLGGLLGQHEQIQAAIVAIFGALENAGCHPVLLKGEGLSFIYPHNSIRPCGDIDIYVGSVDFEKACTIICSLCGVDSNKEQFYSEVLHFHVNYFGIVVEIHHHAGLGANHRYTEDYFRISEEYLQPHKCDSVMIQGKSILVPALQFNLFYVFDHLCKHFRNEGVGIRQFVDVLMLLRQADHCGRFNYSLLREQLSSVGVLRAWKVLGGIFTEQLGFDKRKYPFYSDYLARQSQVRILEIVLSGGSFGGIYSVKRDTYKKNKGTYWALYRTYTRILESIDLLRLLPAQAMDNIFSRSKIILKCPYSKRW